MTVTIKYQSQFSNDTLTSYTKQWATAHGDIKNAEAPGFVKDVGAITGGAPGDWLNGNQYAIGSSHGADTGMIITGELHYSFMFQHTFYGKMESLELGENLSDNPNGIGKQLDQVQLKICGLDITGDYDPAKTMVENHQGEMHKATYGLMRGNADPLLEVLTAKGIDVNTPLKDMAIASQFEEAMVSDMPMIDTVGVVESSDMLLAA
ncbi:TPA: heme acquisition hemophore HasA [Yersinia enterocolitica]|uniref:heme acquisition protein HasA n=1 Tax=Yersinia enterocolitica TaxID=630 RepID=UPI000A7425C1|nr:heme acquisition protein HasA [Yersinia enterocolitica]MBW5835827.1 heme acquisition hemophore HasA [Yersinia enterocolitica]HEN3619188.1 heme acquisition hemophore HasA [Yersinia enterocolitica]HEN3627357.1 heme acquisition hemophore HasA [Yersinia enterocolitica]HEN3630511.1 heme acquisition hemophore HasA [Yersinia enterocolitica]HEN3634296.1 heme acquisition hemophore HasA [Yersinia enterocolitica]